MREALARKKFFFLRGMVVNNPPPHALRTGRGLQEKQKAHYLDKSELGSGAYFVECYVFQSILLL